MEKKKEQYTGKIERVPTGIDGLDKMIEGGFVNNTTVMLRGGSGTGKTLFCLQYLYHGITKYKQPGVFFSFAETKDSVFRHGRVLGWDFEGLEKKGLFEFVKYEPHEVAKTMEEGGGAIKEMMEAMKAKRLVIDSLTAYSLLFDSKYKQHESILTLFEMLTKASCTTLVTSEVPVTMEYETKGRLGFLTDGIINLYYLRSGTKRIRGLEIIKMRDTTHMDRLSKFSIDKKGVVVSPGVDPLGRKK